MAIRIDSSQACRALGAEARQADLELVECTLCGHQCVVDHEGLRIYTNPEDLAVWFINTADDEQPCPGCQRSDWDFVGVTQVSRAWQWLIRPG